MFFTKTKKAKLIVKALTAAGVRPTASDLALILEDKKTFEEAHDAAKKYYWKTAAPF